MRVISREIGTGSHDGEWFFSLEAKVEINPIWAETIKNIENPDPVFFYDRQLFLERIYDAAGISPICYNGPGRKSIYEPSWRFYQCDPSNVITIIQNGSLDI